MNLDEISGGNGKGPASAAVPATKPAVAVVSEQPPRRLCFACHREIASEDTSAVLAAQLVPAPKRSSSRAAVTARHVRFHADCYPAQDERFARVRRDSESTQHRNRPPKYAEASCR